MAANNSSKQAAAACRCRKWSPAARTLKPCLSIAWLSGLALLVMSVVVSAGTLPAQRAAGAAAVPQVMPVAAAGAGAGAAASTKQVQSTTQAAAQVIATPAAAGQTIAAAAALPKVVTANTTAAAPEAAAAAKQKWKPNYPFPQCIDTTQSYDVSFVGPLQYIQVGTVKYAYHRFGPLNPAAAAQQPRFRSEMERAHANPEPNSPVVFISGWGMSMYMWPVPLLRRIAEAREVIVFDNMRSGLSTDSSSTPLTIPLMANSTAALIAKLGLNQPDIWSWSVGGCVAYALLAFNSDKVDNVIVAAGSPGGPGAWLAPPEVINKVLSVGSDYTALLTYLFPLGAKDDGVCPFFASYNSFYASQHTKLEKPISKQAMAEQGDAVVKFFQDPTVINKLSSVSNRLLILHGVKDRIMPIRNAGLGSSRVLGSWALEFPGEGHGIPFSHIQATIHSTLEFFSFANQMTTAEVDEWSHYGENVAERQTREAAKPNWLPVPSSSAEATSLPQQQSVQVAKPAAVQQQQPKLIDIGKGPNGVLIKVNLGH